MKNIYLCGPIMDEHEGEARKWREQAKKDLGNEFNLLDPMRRNFKDREVDSANEIVEFDLQDIRDADIVLVNYCKNSVGTSTPNLREPITRSRISGPSSISLRRLPR